MGRELGAVVNDIGMGTYQWVQLLLLGGIMLSDGGEVLLSSTLLGALSAEWQLTPMMRAGMMSSIFVGVFIGGLIGGRIGDSYGRRTATIISYVGILVFGAGTAASQGAHSMLCFRFMFGASFGCGMGPGIALQVECAPSNWRAHVINLGGIWFTLGEVYVAVLLLIFMPDLKDADGTQWRYVTVLSMAPGLLLFPITWLLLQESPRFLLEQGRRTEAIASLQYIGYINNAADKVDGLDGENEDDRLADNGQSASSSSSSPAAETMLKQEASSSSGARRPSQLTAEARAVVIKEELQNARQPTLGETCSILFSSQYRSIVLGGAYICFLSNFLFYGLTYALPEIFAMHTKDLEPAFQVLIISLCDLPGVLLSFFLIYMKSISHRGSLMMLAAIAGVLSLVLISIDHGPDGLYVGLPSAYLIKYVTSGFFTLSYVYLSEVFPSNIRSSGLSVCIAFGRIGSMAAPPIVESLHIKGFKLGEHAPFLLLTSGLCFIGVIVIKLALHFECKNVDLVEDPAAWAASAKAQEKEDSRVPLTPHNPEKAAPAG